MGYPTFEEWKKSLQPDLRAKVEQQVEELRTLGDDDPESTVRSETSEDFPQRAKFLLLKKVWADAIEPWRTHAKGWVARHIGFWKEEPNGYFGDAGAALQRMKDAGVSEEDIASVARMIAYETAFSFVQVLDQGCDEEAPRHLPGWVMLEADENGESTGRVMEGLHESILSADPSGFEGRVE